MPDDLFEIKICDENGEVLLHKQMTKEEAEQAILAFDFVKNRRPIALVRAVLSAGLYSVEGRVLLAKRLRSDPPHDL